MEHLITVLLEILTPHLGRAAARAFGLPGAPDGCRGWPKRTRGLFWSMRDLLKDLWVPETPRGHHGRGSLYSWLNYVFGPPKPCFVTSSCAPVDRELRAVPNHP